MVQQCDLPNCRATSRGNKRRVHQLSFHRLPFNQPDRLDSWCRRLEKYGLHIDKNADEKKRVLYRICSKHFRPQDYEPSCRFAKLKPYAVPSIFETEDIHARASIEKKPNHKFLHDHGLYAVGTQEDVKQKLENVNFLQEQLRIKTDLVNKERKKAERVTTVLQTIARQQGLGDEQSSSQIARIVNQNLKQSGQLTPDTEGQETQNIPEVHAENIPDAQQPGNILEIQTVNIPEEQQPENILEIQAVNIPDKQQPENILEAQNIQDVKLQVGDILSRFADTVRQQRVANNKEEVDTDRALTTIHDARSYKDSVHVTCLNHEESLRIMSYFKDVLGSKISYIQMMALNETSPHPVVMRTPVRKTKKHKYRNVAEAPQEVVKRISLDVNGRHPVIKKLLAFKTSNPELAKRIAKQVYDNARLVAGELNDYKSMLKRMKTIMEAAMDKH